MKQILKTTTQNTWNFTIERRNFVENRTFHLMADFENDEFWIERDDGRILWDLTSTKTWRKIDGIWHNKNVAVRMFNRFAAGNLSA